MWIWLTATAKANATAEAIQNRRRDWIRLGQDRKLSEACATAWRYVVEKQPRPQVFWILETEDRNAVNIVTDHFGDLWDITVYEVSPESLG